MEMCIHRAARAERREPDQDSDDSRRRTFGDAGDQPAGGALLLSRRADRFSGQTPCGTELEDADHTQEEIAGIQRRCSSGQKIATLKTKARPRKVQGTKYKCGCGQRDSDWYASGLEWRSIRNDNLRMAMRRKAL